MDNKALLDKEIESLLKELKTVDPCTEEYAKISDNLETLCKLSLSYDEAERERASMLMKNDNDVRELKSTKVHNGVKVITDVLLGVAGIVIPTGVKLLMWSIGLDFETTGAFQSPLVKNLIDFNPTKK